MSNTAEAIHINVATREDLEKGLEAAESALKAAAKLTGTHGILITRCRPGHYMAALSEQVPYGITQEFLR